MVEYGKKLSEYNVGDIVYVCRAIFVNEGFKWRKVKVMEKPNPQAGPAGTAIGVTECEDGTVFYTTMLTTALTEQEYNDIKLEEKFKW